MQNADAYLWARIGCVASLGAAIAPWPDDYYTLVHLGVCLVCGHGAFIAFWRARNASTDGWREKQRRWFWALGIVALLFNPFLPVRLTRDTWLILELATAFLFGAHVRPDLRGRIRRAKPTK
jgi:hypothetical protein